MPEWFQGRGFDSNPETILSGRKSQNSKNGAKRWALIYEEGGVRKGEVFNQIFGGTGNTSKVKPVISYPEMISISVSYMAEGVKGF